MSIASEITALNNNLEAAKAAIEAAGGTVGDTGLAGLATEISSIPSGGGEPTPGENDYGVLTYYPRTTGEVSYLQGNGCDVELVDEDKTVQMAANYPVVEDIYFQYQGDDIWECWCWDSSPRFTTEELTTLWGLAVSNIDTSVDYIQIQLECYPDVDKSTVGYITVSTQSEYEALGSLPATIGGVTIGVGKIKKFCFGGIATTTPDNFLAQSTVEEVDTSRCTNMTSIGDNFLYGCSSLFMNSYTLLSSFENVVTIGDNFLSGCKGVISLDKYNTPFCFPKATTIGTNFMSVTGVKSTFFYRDLPKIETIGDSFLAHSSVEYVELWNNDCTIQHIGNDAFANCANLSLMSMFKGRQTTSDLTIGNNFCESCPLLIQINFGWNSSIDLSTVFNPESWDHSFTSASTDLAYVSGIAVSSGTAAMQTQLKTIFPNVTTGTRRRKWRE